MVLQRYDFSMERPEAQQVATAELLVHIGRRALAGGRLHGLTPVQWGALRYFARANRFSRTPSAFASFQATTRGTASQTIRSLEDAGYLQRQPDAADGRSIRFEPTEAGRRLLDNDPLAAVVQAIGRLPEDQRGTLHASLAPIVDAMAHSDAGPEFGTCHQCCHLAHDHAGGGCPYFCRREQAALAERELDGLCVYFTAAHREDSQDNPSP